MLEIIQKQSNELQLSGRFDASQAEKALQVLSVQTESVVIDMSELDYISSMGLGVLIQTFKRLEQSGHTLKLKNLNNHIRDVFKYTRLDQVMEII